MQSSRAYHSQGRYPAQDKWASGQDPSCPPRASERHFHLSWLPDHRQRGRATVQVHAGMARWQPSLFWEHSAPCNLKKSMALLWKQAPPARATAVWSMMDEDGLLALWLVQQGNAKRAAHYFVMRMMINHYLMILSVECESPSSDLCVLWYLWWPFCPYLMFLWLHGNWDSFVTFSLFDMVELLYLIQ